MPVTDTISAELADIYVFHGDNQFFLEDGLHKISSLVSRENIFDTAPTILDGSALSFQQFLNACAKLELGNPKKLVIVEDALQFLKKKSEQEKFIDFLQSFPVGLMLVLIVEDRKKYQNRAWDWEMVKKGHWLAQAIKKFPGSAVWLSRAQPRQNEMRAWITQETRRQGGQIESGAAAVLANAIGTNLFQARQEIEKALDYLDGEEPITADVVYALCPQTREEGIYDLIDAISERKASRAMDLLQRVRIDYPTQVIFSLIAQQFRMLIIAKEILKKGGGVKDIIAACDLWTKQFVGKKLQRQCRGFEMETLERTLARLDGIDMDIKGGRASLDAEVDRLIADICLLD